MALNGYYDVTAYGADPTGATDSTGAIQVAVQTCKSAIPPGGVIWFPPGTYKVSANSSAGAITLGPGIELRGAAAGSTTIKTTATGVPQPIVSGSSSNLVAVRDLGFLGLTTGHGTSSTPPVLNFTNSTNVKVLSCYFLDNAGTTIDLAAVTDAEIADCSFNSVGYSGYRTDAISVGSSSTGVQIHDNFFNACAYGAVYIQGNECDVSHNAFSSTSANAIYFSGQDTGVALNSINTVDNVSGATGIGIQADGAQRFCIIGNNVSGSQGDGIAITNGWSDGVVAANNSRNSGTGSTDANISVSGATAQTNQGLVLMANNAFNDSGTTAYGILFGTDGSQAQNTCVMGNNTYGSVTQGMSDSNNLLVADSNTVIGNSAWLERLHTTAPSSEYSGTAFSTLASTAIAAGSIRQVGGLRITAAGSTSGTDQKSINLGYGSVNNIINGIKFTPTASTGTWELLVVTVNNNTGTGTLNNQQACLVLVWANNTLLEAKEIITTQPTQQAHDVNIQAKNATGGSGNWITVDFMTTERC